MRAQTIPALLLAALLLALLCPGQAPAQENVYGEITEYGLFQITTSEEVISQGGDNTSTVNKLQDQALIEQTDRVPIQDGVTFGFNWNVLGYPEGKVIPLTLVLVYPDGRVERGMDHTTLGTQQHTSLTIGDLTMPEGIYTLAAQYDGRALVSHKFELYRP